MPYIFDTLLVLFFCYLQTVRQDYQGSFLSRVHSPFCRLFIYLDAHSLVAFVPSATAAIGVLGLPKLDSSTIMSCTRRAPSKILSSYHENSTSRKLFFERAAYKEASTGSYPAHCRVLVMG